MENQCIQALFRPNTPPPPQSKGNLLKCQNLIKLDENEEYPPPHFGCQIWMLEWGQIPLKGPIWGNSDENFSKKSKNVMRQYRVTQKRLHVKIAKMC